MHLSAKCSEKISSVSPPPLFVWQKRAAENRNKNSSPQKLRPPSRRWRPSIYFFSRVLLRLVSRNASRRPRRTRFLHVALQLWQVSFSNCLQCLQHRRIFLRRHVVVVHVRLRRPRR